MQKNSNAWLHGRLSSKAGLKIEAKYLPLIQLTYKNKTYKIMTANRDDYVVTTDAIESVAGMGGNLLAYPKGMEPGEEAVRLGESMGVRVMPYSELFKELHIGR